MRMFPSYLLTLSLLSALLTFGTRAILPCEPKVTPHLGLPQRLQTPPLGANSSVLKDETKTGDLTLRWLSGLCQRWYLTLAFGDKSLLEVICKWLTPETRKAFKLQPKTLNSLQWLRLILCNFFQVKLSQQKDGGVCSNSIPTK